MKNLFCFGYGYVAARLGGALSGNDWQVSGTRRIPGAARDGDAALLPFDGRRCRRRPGQSLPARPTCCSASRPASTATLRFAFSTRQPCRP